MDIENRTAIQKIREDHPKIATAAAASLITVGSVALAPAILVGGLSALGFTASGVAAGGLLVLIIKIKFCVTIL